MAELQEQEPFSVEDACARLKSGSTMKMVAPIYGMSTKTLQRRMREAGIDSRFDIRWSDEEVTEAVLELKEDAGFADLGVVFTQGARPGTAGCWNPAALIFPQISAAYHSLIPHLSSPLSPPPPCVFLFCCREAG